MNRKRPTTLRPTTMPESYYDVVAGICYEACRQLAVSRGDRSRQPWEFAGPLEREAARARVALFVGRDDMPDEPDFDLRIYQRLTNLFATHRE